MPHLSRRDFLKLSTSTIVGLRFSPFLPGRETFDDSLQARVASKSVSVYSGPSDQTRVVSQRFRDELVNIYEEVNGGAPIYNLIWYRVWGGYLHRGRLQEEWSPITPDIPLEKKRIEVSLSRQVLTAYEFDEAVFQTNIASGIATVQRQAGSLSTQTPVGEFRILSKYPSKHMGNGNLFAGPDEYELPGVPWTCFFHEAGYAFHGTYWHDNFGTPMSRGCINMRIDEAKWLFRWVRPVREPDCTYTPGYGTLVIVTP